MRSKIASEHHALRKQRRDRLLRGLGVHAAALAMILALASPSTTHAAPATQVFTVYVSSTGSDVNDGLNPATPVASLSAAHDVVWEHQPDTEVEVRVEAGLYEAPTTIWNYYVPGKSVSFMPADYEIGDSLTDISGRPVFRGMGADGGGTGFWMHATVPAGDHGGTTGYRFYFLEIQRYERGGLLFAGGAGPDADNIIRPTNAGVNGNSVIGMVFREIGTTWVQGDAVMGYDGIGLSNSSDNVMEYNQFINLENFDDDASTAHSTGGNHMHGIYLTNHSSNNTIRYNQFDQISGDPVKAKNDSNDNVIEANVSTNSGTVAFFHDWFCDFTTNCANRQPQECASHGNVISGNVIESSYGHGRIDDAALLIPGQEYPGGAGCDNEGQDRVVISGNVNRTDDNAADLRLNTNSLAVGAVGQSYSYQLDSRGGHEPLTWSASGLPAGLTINAATGLISGTPTESTSEPVAVTVGVTDINDVSDELILRLHIAAQPAAVDSRSIAFDAWPDGTNVAYVVSHSHELTLNAVDVITGDLLDAVVLSTDIGTKSYSSHVSDSGRVYTPTGHEGVFIYDPSTGEAWRVPSIAGEVNIAMVSSYDDIVMGVTAAGIPFTIDDDAAPGSAVTTHGPYMTASSSGAAVAVGPDEAYFGTARVLSRVFARAHDTGAVREIPLPSGYEGDIKVQDLTYRDGHLFVFTTNSRDLLAYDLAADEWVASMPLMGGSRISSVVDGKAYLVSDDTKALTWFDFAMQEFVQSAMASNSISYSRAYGIEAFVDADTGHTYVIGAGANGGLWHYPVDTGPLRFYPSQARSGPEQPVPLSVVPAWVRFDRHEIPVGSELMPGVAGEAYSQELRAVGGDGDYAWSLEAGELPDGLTLSSAGLIAGVTDSVGRHYIKVGVTESEGVYAEVNLILTFGGAVLEEPTIPRPEVEPSLGLTDGTVQAGKAISVTGEGFVPGSVIQLEMRPDAGVIASVVVDEDGRFSRSVQMPDGIEPGDYTLYAVGQDGDLASADITVLTAESDDDGSGDADEPGDTDDNGSDGDDRDPGGGQVQGGENELSATGLTPAAQLLTAVLLLSTAGGLLLDRARRRPCALSS